MSKEVYETKNNRLKIKDNGAFLQMLSGLDLKAYKKVEEYGLKYLNKYGEDIPTEERISLVGFAITKAKDSFDPSQNTNFLTHYTNKLRGEVSIYRDKASSLSKKIKSAITNEKEDYAFSYKKETGATTMEKVDYESEEDKLLAFDLYKRQLQAFRMAFSNLPLDLQYILIRSTQKGVSFEKIAEELKESKPTIVLLRNIALSLILQKVLRSNHLSEEEKEEVRLSHGLV